MVMCSSCSFAIDDDLRYESIRDKSSCLLSKFVYDNDLYKYAIKQKLILIDDI